jgi:hypothetical protein
MPRFDRSGPEGKGSQTGRGLGKCNPKSQETDQQVPSEDQQRPASQNRGCGRGQRMRRGRGSS